MGINKLTSLFLLSVLITFFPFVQTKGYAQVDTSYVDTMMVVDNSGKAGDTVTVAIALSNSLPVMGFYCRIVFDSLVLAPIEVERTGSRTEGLGNIFGYDVDTPGVVFFFWANSSQALEPGSGPISYVIFRIDPTADSAKVPIEFEDGDGHQNSISTGTGVIIPILKDGVLTVESSGINDPEHWPKLPRSPFLGQNYPNPFNSTTIIPFVVSEGDPTYVKLCVYNIQGELVRNLFTGQKMPGHYLINWDGRNGQGDEVSSGIYICRMTTGDYKIERKMVFLR